MQEQSGEVASITQLLTNMFDAVRYSDQARDLDGKKAMLERELQDKTRRFDDFSNNLTRILNELLTEAPGDLSEDLSRRITSFAGAALEKALAELRERTRSRIDELQNAYEGERVKSLKSLEGYLAFSPLHVTDNAISLRLAEGAYEAKSKYRCDGSIEYEFSLGTKNTKMFGGELNFSTLSKEVRIPVQLAKTWIKKEPVPKFVNASDYSLKSAELTGRNLVATVEHAEDGSRIMFVCSQNTSHLSVSVEYTDRSGTVNVTGDQALNRHLQEDALKASMELLWSGLLELEKSKVALTAVRLDEGDVLKGLDCFRLLMKILEVMPPKHKQLLRTLLTESKTDTLSLQFIRERLRLLGPRMNTVADALGISDLVSQNS